MNKRLIRLAGVKQRQFAIDCIKQAPDGHFVQISAPTRTLEQNSKLWPMLEDIQRQVPGMETYSTEDIKNRFLNHLGVEMRFLPVLEGEGSFPIGMRSSTLTKEQFSGLLELLYEWGARHGVKWTEPVERKAA